MISITFDLERDRYQRGKTQPFGRAFSLLDERFFNRYLSPFMAISRVSLRWLASIFLISLCMLWSIFKKRQSASMICLMMTDLLSFSLSSLGVSGVSNFLPQMPFLVKICLSFSRKIFSRKYSTLISAILFFSWFRNQTSKIDVFPLLICYTWNLTSLISTYWCTRENLNTSDIFTAIFMLGKKLFSRLWRANSFSKTLPSFLETRKRKEWRRSSRKRISTLWMQMKCLEREESQSLQLETSQQRQPTQLPSYMRTQIEKALTILISLPRWAITVAIEKLPSPITTGTSFPS